MPTPVEAQQAALDAYNIAVTHLNDAQAKMAELQTSSRPSDQAGQDNTGAKQYDDDFRAAQAAVESAKSEAATAARAYSSILNTQANEQAKENSPQALATAEQNRARAALYQARAEGYAADTQAKRDQAQQRADAAQQRADAASDRVTAQNARDTATAGEATARAAAIPAATANAAAQTTNTATNEAAARTESNRHNQADEANAARLASAVEARDKANAAVEQERIAYDNKLADITDRHNQGLISVEEAKNEIDKAHNEATDAATVARDANNAWFQQQQAANATGQLGVNSAQQQTQAAQQAETARANQATEAETTRSNQAREAEAQVTAAETQRSNQARETQQGAATGAGILQNRITETSGLMNNTLNPAMQSKNIGLGSMPDVSGLPAAASAFITGLGGGQSTYDTAAAMVHAANPSMAMTPAGAGYASVLAQIQDAAAKYGVGSAQQDNGPGNSFQTNEPGAPNSVSLSGPAQTPAAAPSTPTTTIAPDGTVTIQHAPFAQSDIAEGSSRR